MGWAITRLLVSIVGKVGAWLVLLLLLVGGGVLGFSLSKAHFVGIWQSVLQGVEWIRSRLTREDDQAPVINAPETPARKKPSRPKLPKSETEPKAVAQAEAAVPQRTRRAKGHLPPLDILDPGSPHKFNEGDARVRAALIEDTLASFGVPAKVVEINVGPVVTQFGVEPGYIEAPGTNGNVRQRKVRVSKIYSLANDLALALAASPIRIEAPVPGKSLVGVEVPNADISLVSLRSVLESDAFRKSKGRLKFALGHNVSGRPVFADLAEMPHLLIAGATGSGKSVCINAIISSLIFNNEPDGLRMVMIDPKMVELTRYNGLPHLIAPVVVELESAVSALRWVTFQMDERYRKFSADKARHLEDYNRKIAARGEEPLPRLVVLIDELADLMMMSPEEVERSICRIAQMARATGIHLVIATQRPSVDVLTGLIKANFPARMAFAVTSQIDSRVVLDTPGADKLLGRGDALYMAPDSPKLERVQGCYVSDPELTRLVNFWKNQMVDRPAATGDLALRDTLEGPFVQKPLWPALESLPDEPDDRDALLAQATELVRREGRASVSFLQRHLRIGYTRAARLIDTLQAEGVIGPPTGPSQSREILPYEEQKGD